MADLAAQVIAQFTTGAFGGALIESFFPEPESVSDANVLKATLETVGQLGVNAVATWQGFNNMYERNIINGVDPSKNVTYFFALYASQPKLAQKIQNITTYAKTKLNGFYFSNSREVSAVNFGESKPVNMDFTSKFTVESDSNIQMSDFDPLNEE